VIWLEGYGFWYHEDDDWKMAAKYVMGLGEDLEEVSMESDQPYRWACMA
jgi:hypothetical protein